MASLFRVSSSCPARELFFLKIMFFPCNCSSWTKFCSLLYWETLQQSLGTSWNSFLFQVLSYIVIDRISGKYISVLKHFWRDSISVFMTKLNTWFLLSFLDNSGYIYSKHWMIQLEGRLWWISLASTGTGLTSSKGNVAGVNWLLTCFLLAWKVNSFLRLEEKGRRLHQQFCIWVPEGLSNGFSPSFCVLLQRR